MADEVTVEDDKGKLTMSDPAAMPKGGNEDEVKKRIDDAIADNRWVRVGREYQEEWHKVMLITMNGIKGMAVLIDKAKDGESIAMVMGGTDAQVGRISALTEHMSKYSWACDGKPLPDTFLPTLAQCADEMKGLMGIPTVDSFKTVCGSVWPKMKAAMESAGYEFDEADSLLGKRFTFKAGKELKYKGVAK